VPCNPSRKDQIRRKVRRRWSEGIMDQLKRSVKEMKSVGIFGFVRETQKWVLDDLGKKLSQWNWDGRRS